MSDVCNFLSISLILDHVNDSWYIILGHILKSEVPELLLVGVGIQFLMLTTERIAARVT